MLACYWSALVVNFVWARSWTIRNFERLVERTGMQSQAVSMTTAGALQGPFIRSNQISACSR